LCDTHPYIHTDTDRSTFHKPRFIFRRALNTEICHNLETDFFRDHNTFSYIICIQESKKAFNVLSIIFILDAVNSNKYTVLKLRTKTDRSEALMAVTMKITTLWDAMQSSRQLPLFWRKLPPPSSG
jgi:hypothetical protein